VVEGEGAQSLEELAQVLEAPDLVEREPLGAIATVGRCQRQGLGQEPRVVAIDVVEVPCRTGPVLPRRNDTLAAQEPCGLNRVGSDVHLEHPSLGTPERLGVAGATDVLRHSLGFGSDQFEDQRTSLVLRHGTRPVNGHAQKLGELCGLPEGDLRLQCFEC